MSYRKIEKEKGIALIMALWIMTILVMVTASFAFMMRTEMKMAANFRDEVQAHYLARAGIEYAITVLYNDNGNSYDHLDEAWAMTDYTQTLGRGQFTITVEDEQGKVNIDTATPTWDGEDAIAFPYRTDPVNVYGGGGLMNFLYGPSYGRTENTNRIYATAGKIRDYRDTNTDGNWEQTVTTEPDYKNQAFDTAREVARLDDINLQTSEHNRGWITIWSAGAAGNGTNVPPNETTRPGNNKAGCGMINVNTAPDADLDEGPLRAVVAVVLDSISGIGTVTINNAASSIYSNRPYTDVNNIDSGNGTYNTYLINSNYFTVKSDYFRITSTGEVLRGGDVVAQSKIEAVIDRNFVVDDRVGSEQIEILYWSEYVQRYEAEDE